MVRFYFLARAAIKGRLFFLHLFSNYRLTYAARCISISKCEVDKETNSFVQRLIAGERDLSSFFEKKILLHLNNNNITSETVCQVSIGERQLQFTSTPGTNCQVLSQKEFYGGDMEMPHNLLNRLRNLVVYVLSQDGQRKEAKMLTLEETQELIMRSQYYRDGLDYSKIRTSLWGVLCNAENNSAAFRQSTADSFVLIYQYGYTMGKFDATQNNHTNLQKIFDKLVDNQ